MLKTIEIYYILLLLYSIIGWFWESAIYSPVIDKKFINRGFFNGPYCPIYGFGSLIDVLVLGWIDNPITLFFTSGFVCCVFEYIISYVMEKMYHARWWDYSFMKFHINGRVCLAGFFTFGLFSDMLVFFLNPFMYNTVGHLSDLHLHIIVLLSLSVIIFDVIFTFASFAGFERKLSELPNIIKFATENVKNTLIHYMNKQQLRIIRAFPGLKSEKYDQLLDNIRESIKQSDSAKKENLKRKKQTGDEHVAEKN